MLGGFEGRVSSSAYRVVLVGAGIELFAIGWVEGVEGVRGTTGVLGWVSLLMLGEGGF